jgi:chaperonin GroES
MEGFIVLKPLGDRVVIKVAQEEEKTVGGIVLASAAKEKPQTGEVIAVGEGRVLDNGTKVPAEVKVGDSVMFEKYSGTEVKFEGTEYLIVSGKDIIAIVE